MSSKPSISEDERPLLMDHPHGTVLRQMGMHSSESYLGTVGKHALNEVGLVYRDTERGKPPLNVTVSGNGVLSVDPKVMLSQIPEEERKDLIFTHNHPNDLPLSEPDLSVAGTLDLKEVRAVTQYGTFSMGRPEGGWPRVIDRLDHANNLWGDVSKTTNETLKLDQRMTKTDLRNMTDIREDGPGNWQKEYIQYRTLQEYAKRTGSEFIFTPNMDSQRRGYNRMEDLGKRFEQELPITERKVYSKEEPVLSKKGQQGKKKRSMEI